MNKYILCLLFIVFSYTSYSQNDDKRGLLIDLYPNPSTQFINIKFENNRIADDFLLSIHSLIGNRVEFVSEKIDDSSIRINIEDFDRGFFFLMVDDKISSRRKIIKFLKN